MDNIDLNIKLNVKRIFIRNNKLILNFINYFDINRIDLI